MGYTTDFSGAFNFDKPLSTAQIEYINMFSETRRMGRDERQLKHMKAHGQGNIRCFELLEELNLPIGANGEFYCGEGSYGQDHDDSIIDYNSSKQPGLWCQWVVDEEGDKLVWNGGEKFYNYVEWLKYLIQHFFMPWGYKLSGEVSWRGEDHSDIGVIKVVDNVVTVHEGVLEIPKAKPVAKVKTPKAKPAMSLMESVMSEQTDKTVEAIVLDLVKLRNKLAATSKGTKVAARMIDVLIAKYEA